MPPSTDSTSTARQLRKAAGNGSDNSTGKRKAEREELLREVEQLESTFSSLKRKLRPRDCALLDKQLRHNAIRRAIRPSALAMAEIESLYSAYTTTRLQSPAQSYIHLTQDAAQRHSVLMGRKSHKLRLAKRFLDHRFGCIDLHRLLSKKQEFDSLDGGYCAIHCEMLRFEGVQSLKDVFDSVVFNLTSMEMAVSDHTGGISLRLDSDDIDPGNGVAQVRIVTTVPSGLRVDSNFVLFSEYYEDKGQGESAQIVVDFVDRDDLYPFQSQEHIRKDPTAFGRLLCLPRKDESKPLVVVMQRWSTMHLRKPEFEVPKAAWQGLKMNMDAWSETMQQNVLAGVQSRQRATTA